MRYHCLENKDTDKTENKESDSPETKQANSWNLFARKTEKIYLHDTKE